MISQLNLNDNLENYLELLNQLSPVNLSINQIKEIIKELPKNHFIIILKIDNKIIGSGTIILEQKIIHNGKKVGHIEDIIIDKDYQGKGYGKILIDYLVNLGKENDCYKVILNCANNKKEFYQKCNFEEKNIQMALYF
jgi:glucosamine-phosphate N-acetyltransferase